MTGLRAFGGAALGLAAVLLSCARPATPPGLAMARAGQAQSVRVLDPSDWRRAIVGRWNVTFVVESVSAATRDAPAVWRTVSNRTLSSHLIVYDSLVQDFPAVGLRRSELPDFRSVLERSLSCSEPDRRVLGVRRTDEGVVVLDFVPEARDCGLRAEVRLGQDSLLGRWHEPSIGLAAAVGRIRLVRQR
ncbi:MAG TPA: hypothetical protein VNL98_12190 [Gemmatimonadales bacterium]|nr:hypothetical protein [Gemmatimonadales bacterium]